MLTEYIPPKKWWWREKKLLFTINIYPKWIAQKLCPHDEIRIAWLSIKDDIIYSSHGVCRECYKDFEFLEPFELCSTVNKDGKILDYDGCIRMSEILKVRN